MCRKTGLESKRRCGWLPAREDPAAQPVWARQQVSTTVCPKSLVTAESLSLVEEFFVRRRLGGFRLDELTARQAEAFLILERELQAEKIDGQHNTRRNLEDLLGNRG